MSSIKSMQHSIEIHKNICCKSKSKQFKNIKHTQKLHVSNPMCFLGQTEDKKVRSNRSNMMSYHPDSIEIGIDTLSTYCLTNNLQDFEGETIQSKGRVLGVSNTMTEVTRRGTATFQICDDTGMIHNWIIPELYYCASTPYRVISPQHLDACWRKHKIGKLTEATSSEGTILQWSTTDGNQYYKTLRHKKNSKVPLMHTMPSILNYEKFHKRNGKTNSTERKLLACSAAHIIPPDDEDEPISIQRQVSNDHTQQHHAKYTTLPTNEDGDDFQLRQKPILVNFHDNELNLKEQIKDEFIHLDAKSLKLLWHHRLGHMPFSVINRMAMNNELPQRIARVKDPMCTACQYGTATRRPWRTRAKSTPVGRQHNITRPGDCISIDQMESPVPGLIAQMKGLPRKERYWGATIFVDHYSDITFVHLQKSLNALETIEAKRAFERWSNSCGVKIRHY